MSCSLLSQNLYVNEALADKTKEMNQLMVEKRLRISYGWIKVGNRLMNSAAVTVPTAKSTFRSRHSGLWPIGHQLEQFHEYN